MLTMRKSGGPRVRFWPLALALIVLAGCEPTGTHLLLEGEKLIQQGAFAAAVEKLQTAATLLTLPAQGAQAWNHLGLALHGAGRPREAEQAYRKALSLDPDLAVVRFNAGCLSLEQNQLAAAMDDLRSYTLLRTNVVEGWVKLGTAQLRARQNDAAEKSFQTALRLDAKLPEALNNLGVIQQQRKKTRDAQSRFLEALKHRPDYGPALLNLAIVSQQYAIGRPYALEKYREYLALQPRADHWAAVSEVARQLEWELRPPPPPVTNIPATNAAALPVRTNAPLARTTAPTNQVASLVPTAAALTTNQTSTIKTNPPLVAKTEMVAPPVEPAPKPALPATIVTALPVVTNAPKPIVVNPPPAPSDTGKPGFFQRINPVNLFRSKPKPAPRTTELKPPSLPATPEVPANPATVKPSPIASLPSQPTYTRYQYVSPTRPAPGNRAEAEGRFNEGLQAQRDKRWAAAEEAYEAALKLDPDFFEAHYNLGLTSLETGNLAQALMNFENALAIDPQSVNARFNFAAVLRRANHPRDAADELEKLLAAEPRETRAHFSLANLYAQQLLQTAAAREHYRKVLELEPNHPQGTAIRYWLAANP